MALGRSYGMGKRKMALTLGMDESRCEEILRAFDATVPYIGQLADDVSAIAGSRGFIRTLIGHKRHFNHWELPQNERTDPNTDYTPLPLAAAQARWPERPLVRAWTYKAFNALCQGGAAGQTKRALVEIKKSVGLPQMTVHDEISKSVLSEKETKTINEIMCTCVPLLAPVRVDMDLGATWC